MGKITAISFLTIRSAIRSRVFISLMILLSLITVIMPLSTDGDGTAIGRMSVLLFYTFGLISIILSLATLWISCGTISHEIENKNICMTVVKPIPRYQILIGKWIGICAMNAFLIAISGIIVYTLITLVILPRSTQEKRADIKNTILTGRRLIKPIPEILSEDEIHAEAQMLYSQGMLSTNLTTDQIHAISKKYLLSRKYALAPGKTKTWVFNIPSDVKDNAHADLHLHTVAYMRDVRTSNGKWDINMSNSTNKFSCTMLDYVDGAHKTSIPSGIISQGQAFLTYSNIVADSSSTTIFEPEKGIQLFVNESSFEGNLLRALIIIFCKLSLIATIGLTASTIFSLPVATFATTGMIIIALATNYYTTIDDQPKGCSHTHHDKPSAIEQFDMKIIKMLAFTISPVTGVDPVTPLSYGHLVSWRLTSKTVAWMIIIYPLIFITLGGWFLSKRELALPDKS